MRREFPVIVSEGNDASLTRFRGVANLDLSNQQKSVTMVCKQILKKWKMKFVLKPHICHETNSPMPFSSSKIQFPPKACDMFPCY